LQGDAEKLFTSEQLWQWFNSRTSGHVNVLFDAITRYMANVDHSEESGDLMRDFFRHHVSSGGITLNLRLDDTQIDGLPDFLPYVAQVVTSRDSETTLERGSEIYEGNEIVIVSLE
jgi:hypothetical protein